MSPVGKRKSASVVPFPSDAQRIGRLYRQGNDSLVEAVKAHAEAGRLLAAKKASLKHGEWLPWLKSNADVLGFKGANTATRLMRMAAKNPSTDSLTLEEAIAISRESWGNTKLGHKDLWRNMQSWSPNDEFFTPIPVIKAVREVLGTIDVDPASSPTAQARIRAKRYYTERTDGLTKEWHGRVFLNPPYSTQLVKAFTAKFIVEWDAGRMTEGIILTLNKTECNWAQPLGAKADAICFWKRVMAFEAAVGSPVCRGYWGHMLCYFGNNKKRFAEVFGKYGFIR